MARRLPPSSSSSFPSSSSSLTILSHLLARGLDELVASVGPALGATPKFFERGWGSLGIVDFSKDELVASLSRFEPSERRCFGAWLEDVEKGPVLDVRTRSAIERNCSDEDKKRRKKNSTPTSH